MFIHIQHRYKKTSLLSFSDNSCSWGAGGKLAIPRDVFFFERGLLVALKSRRFPVPGRWTSSQLNHNRDTISCAGKTSTLQQGSLYYQPKQCSVTIIREIPQNYHRFALFDPPKFQNGSHFMSPVQTSKSTVHVKVIPTLPLCHNNAALGAKIFTTEKPNMERRRPPKEQLLLQIRNAISGNSASSAWISWKQLGKCPRWHCLVLVDGCMRSI